MAPGARHVGPETRSFHGCVSQQFVSSAMWRWISSIPSMRVLRLGALSGRSMCQSRIPGQGYREGTSVGQIHHE